MFQWECNHVLLLEAASIVFILLYLRAGSHGHILDLVFDIQLRKIEEDLPHDLLFLEVVEAEPESLARHLVVFVPGHVPEDERPLEPIIIFESESLVGQLPILIVFDDGFLSGIWRLSSQMELEELDPIFLLTFLLVDCFALCHEPLHEAGSLRSNMLVLYPCQQHLAIPGEEPRVVRLGRGLLLEVRLPSLETGLPGALADLADVRLLIHAQTLDFSPNAFIEEVIAVLETEAVDLELFVGVGFALVDIGMVPIEDDIFAPSHV